MVELNGTTASRPYSPAKIQARSQCDILHVPYTYFPDVVGGTEVYVASLVAALRSHGIGGAVAAPGEAEAEYEYEQVPVYRFATDRNAGLAQAYGMPDAVAARSFAALVARRRPQIVHLHARTAAVSERLANIARRGGARVVLTYHTPTVSCARGTMMRLGRTPCDGRLDRRRCSSCALANHGVPPLVRDALAALPQALGEALGRTGLAGPVLTALRLPSLIGAAHRQFHALMQNVDRVVAPCNWVYEVLRRNGVPDEKLLLCRQGLACPPTRPSAAHWADVEDGASRVALRLGYFGRLDPTKGVDIVIEALRRAPDLAVRLDIYGIRQLGGDAYATRLERIAGGDGRIEFQRAVAPEAVPEKMRNCDLVVVPSRWLETGPLVVLEAFAARTPVLGARLGGIAELVTDGVDGVLVEPDSSAAWAAAIAALAGAPERVGRLRAGIRPPRTMQDVARLMAGHYDTLLADAAA